MPERELPDIARNGILISANNPQPEVRKNAENAKDWEFKNEASYLYLKAVQLRDRLIDPIARVDRNQVPDPVIGFENLRNYKVLAEYLLIRDAVGLSCRINFNSEHYVEKDDKKEWRWGRWAQLETLTHEYVHLWQQQLDIGKAGHGKEFCEKMESMGLHPLPGFGCHMEVADEPFSILMKEWGIDRPDNVPTDNRKLDWFKNGKEVQGRSSLSRWSCGCQNVRVGTKEFHAQCLKCGNVFVKVEKTSQNIHRAIIAPDGEDNSEKSSCILHRESDI